MNKYKTISYSEIKQLKIDLIIANSVPSSSNNSTTNETNITDQLKILKMSKWKKYSKKMLEKFFAKISVPKITILIEI
jgi:hypothetical protein